MVMPLSQLRGDTPDGVQVAGVGDEDIGSAPGVGRAQLLAHSARMRSTPRCSPHWTRCVFFYRSVR